MKKLLLAVVLSGLLGSGFQAQAQQTGSVNVVKESPLITGVLDSLVNLWYLKNTMPTRNRKSVNTFGFRPEEVPVYADSVYTVRLAKMASQCQLPYTYNDKVKAFIDLYAVNKRDLVEKMLGLSEYYFPIYEETFNKYDIPLEFKYLSIVESALNAQAVSKANAVGLWQFMYPTGKIYNLNVTSYVDERKDPVKSTEAAAAYIKDLYNTFGDWFLAMAAYNCGPGNVNKAIRRSGGKKTFWEIYSYLPMETRGYVPAFIAASYVFQHHKEHNLYPQTINLPPMVDTVMVSGELYFQPMAKVLGVSESMLRDLNPQFRKDIIPASPDKPYVINLPGQKAYAFCQLKDSILVCQRAMFPPHNPYRTIQAPVANNAIAANNPAANNGSPEKTDTPDNAAKQELNTPPVAEKVWVAYTVKPYDQLLSIADWFDVSIYNLKRWNGLKKNFAPAGRKLVIFVPKDKTYYYSKINYMTLAQKRKLSSPPVEAIAATPVKPNPAVVRTPAKPAQYYVVQKGDTIWSIAQRYPGVSVEDIKRANGLTDNRTIRVGQKIKIQSAKG